MADRLSWDVVKILLGNDINLDFWLKTTTYPEFEEVAKGILEISCKDTFCVSGYSLSHFYSQVIYNLAFAPIQPIYNRMMNAPVYTLSTPLEYVSVNGNITDTNQVHEQISSTGSEL